MFYFDLQRERLRLKEHKEPSTFLELHLTLFFFVWLKRESKELVLVHFPPNCETGKVGVIVAENTTKLLRPKAGAFY